MIATVLAAALLGLAHAAPTATTLPDAGEGFLFNMSASNVFPNAKSDLSLFDVNAKFIDYPASTESWLHSLDPASAATDLEKAQMLTAAGYARAFDETDADMVQDVTDLMNAVAGTPTPTDASLRPRASYSFTTSARHAVIWHTCATAFSCLTGLTCSKSITPNSVPRSECKRVGGQDCCVSWSDTKVKYFFYSRTYQSCDAAVNDDHLTKASCEGHGGSSAGGDVCLSNRATGCT